MMTKSQCKTTHHHAFGLYTLASPYYRLALKAVYGKKISKVAAKLFKHYRVYYLCLDLDSYVYSMDIRRALDHMASFQDLA